MERDSGLAAFSLGTNGIGAKLVASSLRSPVKHQEVGETTRSNESDINAGVVAGISIVILGIGAGIKYLFGGKEKDDKK